jgi:ATP-dependent DNA helicase RecG
VETRTGSVQFVKGVGPKRAELFKKLDIYTIEDLLFYYPRSWHDRRLNAPVKLFDAGNQLVFFGTVTDARFVHTKTGMGIFTAQILTSKNKDIQAVWYKRFSRFGYDPFSSLKRHVRVDAKIWIVGKPEENHSYLNRINVSEYYPANDETAEKIHINTIVPVYGLTEKLTPKFMRQSVYNASTKYAQTLEDCLPCGLLEKRQLLSLPQAVKGIHFPGSLKELECARHRLVYEEFLMLTTAWHIKRRQTKKDIKGYGYQIKKTILTPFKNNLGFEFTKSQKKVINEIFQDMQSSSAMTRLLQGDVGSGKTVVALSAILLGIENGFQCAFMAPTEILAQQHYLTFEKFLKGLPINFELLTSKVTPKKKKEILTDTAAGKINILIGTHALLEGNIKFKNLRFAVIDEQHRFGVRQRATLRQKAQSTDLLIMTATPIPRTLSLVMYSDLDVSVIDELPPARKPVETFIRNEDEAFETAFREIKKGRQVYIVHPLIDESSRMELKSVKKEFERLEKKFKGFKLDMIHGQMSGRQKAKVMTDFSGGKTDILLATPVIEVGIDVKNATVMIVQNAERFGLASLHQLRGRIGRGTDKSVCILVPQAETNDAKKRIEIMCKTSDGFKIGQKDMEIRGPGQIMGLRQHGDMELELGDIVRDREILGYALEDKTQLLKNDPNLIKSENKSFRKKLVNLYSKKWHVIDLS